MDEINTIAETVKRERKRHKMTQRLLADCAGVGLRFVRELESGKKTLRIDKINCVLTLFGYEVGVVPMRRED